MIPTLSEALDFDVVQIELNSVFYQEFDAIEGLASKATAKSEQLFIPRDTAQAAYIEMVFSGSGLFPKIGESSILPAQNPAVRNKLTTYVADFGSSIPLSANFFDDNMHNVWSETVSDFGEKARLTQDYNSFKVFRNGFSTAASPALTADGVSFFNSAHVLIGGGTTSNVLTGLTGITSDNLNVANYTLINQVDQRGVIRSNTMSILLVPPPLFKVAIEETQSALVSDSANNAINYYRSELGVLVMMSPWLGSAVPDGTGSDTAWFVLAKKHGVRRLIRQGVKTYLTPWWVSQNRTYNYQAYFREETYVVDYAGAVASAT